MKNLNALDGREGCILTWTVESNQGGRFDGNEFVVDSFRCGVVSIVIWKYVYGQIMELLNKSVVSLESTNVSQREPFAPGSPPSPSSLHSETFRSAIAVTVPPVHSNLWDAQLSVPTDPRYARLETNLGIWKAKEE
ncbi:hypothetical protein TNCV_473411 [Trichonephila clavipes]|nr:hypothetical protein TNCV_473411 [Trichonephila clavipes]